MVGKEIPQARLQVDKGGDRNVPMSGFGESSGTDRGESPAASNDYRRVGNLI